METYTTFCSLFFSFTICFSIFTLLLYISRLLKPCCNCDLCRSYLTGSWLKDFDNLSDWYTHLLRNSSTGTIHVHVLGCIITANPNNVEHVLKTKFENYPKGKPFADLVGDLLGKGIFAVDGDAWKFQRKMASLELTSFSIRNYALDTVMEEINARLFPLLSSHVENGAVLDLQDVFQRFSFDNICKFSFGYDPKCLIPSMPTSEFDVAFGTASKISAERGLSAWPLVWKAKRFFNLGSEKELKESIKVVNVLAEKVINEKRKVGFSTQKDLLSRFMESVDDDDKYLRDIVLSFLLAGHDTITSGLTSFFFLLSRHPEVKSAIREETHKVLQNMPELTNFEQLREMHYLHAALYESLRIFPPVQFDSKFAKDDDVLPDSTYVRKSTRVMYHPYAMGRMEQIWGSDCLEFKPERWLKDGIFIPESAYKYPVFQAGLRVCLGKELAIVAIKCVAASLVSRFDIRVSIPEHNFKFVPGLVPSLQGGLPVMIKDQKT